MHLTNCRCWILANGCDDKDDATIGSTRDAKCLDVSNLWPTALTAMIWSQINKILAETGLQCFGLSDQQTTMSTKIIDTKVSDTSVMQDLWAWPHNGQKIAPKYA